MKVNYMGTGSHCYRDMRHINKKLLKGQEVRTDETLTTGT